MIYRPIVSEYLPPSNRCAKSLKPSTNRVGKGANTVITRDMPEVRRRFVYLIRSVSTGLEVGDAKREEMYASRGVRVVSHWYR